MSSSAAALKGLGTLKGLEFDFWIKKKKKKNSCTWLVEISLGRLWYIKFSRFETGLKSGV